MVSVVLQKLDYAHQTTDTHLGGEKERKRRREEGCTDSYSLVPTSCASVGSDGNRSSTQTYTSVVQLKCSKVVFTSGESSLTVSNQCLHRRLRSWLKCPTSIQGSAVLVQT